MPSEQFLQGENMSSKNFDLLMSSIKEFEDVFAMQRHVEQFRSNLKKKLKLAIGVIEKILEVKIDYNYKKCVSTLNSILVDPNGIHYICIHTSNVNFLKNFAGQRKIVFRDNICIFSFIEIIVSSPSTTVSSRHSYKNKFCKINIPLFLLDKDLHKDFEEVCKNIKLVDQMDK